MKILWITNMAICHMSQHLYGRVSSGLWIEATLAEFQRTKEHQIVIATVGKIATTQKLRVDNVTHYLVPDADRSHYDPYKRANQKFWIDIIEEEQPDVIHIWGTEFKHGLCAQLAMKAFPPKKKIPVLIYVQGILKEIAKNYYAGMKMGDILLNATVRDVFTADTIRAQKRSYENRSLDEAKMFRMADGAIIENEWCQNAVLNIAPDILFYRLPLGINRVFLDNKWNLAANKRMNLVCNATGYPLKGLHMLIQALSIVKEAYPDIVLNIPGKDLGASRIKSRVFGSTYAVYINNLIRKHHLQKNVRWHGPLAQDDLVHLMMKCDVFVLCSALENHSSSLKEAMLLGMPCIASSVGGIPEYAINGKNAFLYEYADYVGLAKIIIRLVEEPETSLKMSIEARTTMSRLHDASFEYERLCTIYKDALTIDQKNENT